MTKSPTVPHWLRWKLRFSLQQKENGSNFTMRCVLWFVLIKKDVLNVFLSLCFEMKGCSYFNHRMQEDLGPVQTFRSIVFKGNNINRVKNLTFSQFTSSTGGVINTQPCVCVQQEAGNWNDFICVKWGRGADAVFVNLWMCFCVTLGSS